MIKTLMHDPQQKLRVGFILLESFTLNAFSGFVEAMRLAADSGGRSRHITCDWQVMGSGPVTASCGITVSQIGELVDPASLDYIAVCGGNGYRERTQPYWLNEYLHQANEANIGLIGLCTGTFNITRAGLMKNRQACVHWNVVEEFRKQFPTIKVLSDRIFVDDGDRITCAGSAGATDLALHLIKRHCGNEKAQQSIRHMMLRGIRPSTHPQAHFLNDMANVTDEDVRRCLHLMEQSLNDPPRIPDLARSVDMSPRQLDRRFSKAIGIPPARFYREMRLKYGAWLLIHTTDNITQIAADTGFADAAHFYREFRKHFEMSPKIYRKSNCIEEGLYDG